ncbi:hypothetical protein HPT29_028485 (plasmid) [Microvirga terrae]|uniref:Twin-arginine translocation signal domain-containing protein n=1 Tax=Microvirga terrae TaxID=2740529 RepID=A0ABY5S034_9HYPH|nr:hypothetical protein [Microvirga terrae]UVF22841.1 hypothetical protein HPT29_028485 [Microvirga terrae]
MKTKHADLSRRSVLGGSLAALAASPALATAAVPGGEDSALLAMGQEWQEAWERLLMLYRQSDEGEERYDQPVRETVESLHELEGRIVRTRAKTPKGMLVKAQMAALDPTNVSTVDDLEHALEERLETGHVIGLSLILDVLNLDRRNA